MKRKLFLLALLASFALSTGCMEGGGLGGSSAPARQTVFVGMDISGSFLNGKYYEDALHFLANYISAHMNGYGGLEIPVALFVGSIGGDKPNEPKSFYPIQTFENKSVQEILETLRKMFPKDKSNPFTDYNAFFEQVETTVQNKKLVLKPITILLISDGQPDLPGKKGEKGFASINLKPLEMLSRNITIRLLYTDATVGAAWQNQIPRKRVKIWTQDAVVMTQWKDPKIFLPGKSLSEQTRFIHWIKDNIDFSVRAKRVD